MVSPSPILTVCLIALAWPSMALAEASCPAEQPRVMFSCTTRTHEQIRLCGSADLSQPEARLVLTITGADGKALVHLGEQAHPGQLFAGNQLAGGTMSLSYMRYRDGVQEFVMMSGHDPTNSLAAVGHLQGGSKSTVWWRCGDVWTSELGPPLFVEARMAVDPTLGDMPP